MKSGCTSCGKSCLMGPIFCLMTVVGLVMFSRIDDTKTSL